MGLSSFFQRTNPDDAPATARRAASVADVVERVRTRTRQRLIGAIVLVTIGVIGFPLVFEAQPRPIAVDIPIAIARQDTAVPLVLPARRAPVASGHVEASRAVAASATAAASIGSTTAPAAEPIEAKPASAGAAAAVAAAARASAITPSAAAKPPAPLAVQPKPQASPVSPAIASAVTSVVASTPALVAPAAASVAAATVVPAVSGAASADGAARFVVQVGAFVDAAAVRDVRLKMEKIGLKTYAQVAQTHAGKRTRVRLGPFATRAEADRALARARAAGVAAVVLTL
jgi:DedD protein